MAYKTRQQSDPLKFGKCEEKPFSAIKRSLLGHADNEIGGKKWRTKFSYVSLQWAGKLTTIVPTHNLASLLGIALNSSWTFFMLTGKTPIITYHRRNKRTNGRVNSQQYSSTDNVVTEDIEVANTIMVDPTGGIKNPTQDSCVNPILVLTKINSSSSISTTGTVGAGSEEGS